MDPTTVDPTTTGEFVVIFCLVDMFNINNFFPAPTTINPTTVDPTTKRKFVVVVCLFDMFNVNSFLFQCQP